MNRPAKRTKQDPAALIAQAWECYRNYIDADDEESCEEGAIDELLEVIEILQSFDASAPESLETINTKSLVSILISMSYVHLANYATSYTLDTKSSEMTGFDSPKEYFEKALTFWPDNPSAISLYANFDRINCGCVKDICERYVKAAGFAKQWREWALAYLEKEIDTEADIGGIDVKEWVELLIVNGALGVDCIDEEGEESERDEEGSNEEYSFSEIEATASFMSALLLSTLSKHGEALRMLTKFKLSHRIHPNVWKVAQSNRPEVSNGATSMNNNDDAVLFIPKLYHAREVNTDDECTRGVLPENLYQRMRKLFAPKASYWTESDYNNRGYYSYFIDLDDTSNGKSVRERPTNIIEDVIVHHLLPLAEKTLEEFDGDKSSKIIGAEWWCHSRQLGANLGHQIHYDTDESLLGREKKVTHPIVSSVLYLSGANQMTEETAKAGATVVFNQTPKSKAVASKAWVSHPKDNSFMVFPGNLLHGVLPCTGPKKPITPSDYEKPENNRLTFMVGFWTRNVAEEITEHRELYSPCGPMPPATKEHSWVIQCQQGYKEDKNPNSVQRTDLTGDCLPCTSPAWEEFKNNAQAGHSKGPPLLVVPKGLDHRYFVLDAPNCFTDSLFDNEDCF
eukprot:scaffold10872_cov66-Cyclotella_meneghiniana.AAC.6